MERIKKADKSNIEIVVHMANKLWPSSDFQELRSEFIDILSSEEDLVYLYEIEGKYIGFIHVSLRNDYVEGCSSSPTGYIEGIYVEEGYRLQGVANKLVHTGESWARSKGCKEMGSDVELNNKVSEIFHNKIGYIEANRVICFIKSL